MHNVSRSTASSDGSPGLRHMTAGLSSRLNNAVFAYFTPMTARTTLLSKCSRATPSCDLSARTIFSTHPLDIAINLEIAPQPLVWQARVGLITYKRTCSVCRIAVRWPVEGVLEFDPIST
jgi:hypothetical protein